MVDYGIRGVRSNGSGEAMRYTWKRPKYYPDQLVSFTDAWGTRRVGIVVDVVTHYDANGFSDHGYRVWLNNSTLKRRTYNTTEEMMGRHTTKKGSK